MSKEGTTPNADPASTDPVQLNAGATSASLTEGEDEIAATDQHVTPPPKAAKTTQSAVDEKYFCKDPLSGTWINAQVRLHVAWLGDEDESSKEGEGTSKDEEDKGPSEDEDKDEMSADEEDEMSDEDAEETSDEEVQKAAAEQQNAEEEDDPAGARDGDAGGMEADYDDDLDFIPKGRPILNPEVVLQSAELLFDVFKNNPHKDADTVLGTDKPSGEGVKRKAEPWATVGHPDPAASPRELAKIFYQHVMVFFPKSPEGEPDCNEVYCKSFSTNKEDKEKECKCIKNTHLMMVNDLRILSGGQMDDATAIRIHKARWIGILERLITKILLTAQYPYCEESLFAFLHVALPFPNPSHKNNAPYVMLHDKESGIKISGCYYLMVYILGDAYTFRRCSQFMTQFWSGLKKKNQTRATQYVTDIVVDNARNTLILGSMIDYCIDKETIVDFSPSGGVVVPTLLQYMAVKGVQVGRHTIDLQRKYIAPYYGRIRKVFGELQNRHILLVAHPKLKPESRLEVSDFQVSTLFELGGLKTYEGVEHFAGSAVVDIQQPPLLGLLDAFFQGLVAKAGHSGRKDLDQPPPMPWSKHPENEEDRARKDRKNAQRKGKRKRDGAEKAQGGKSKPKKVGRGHPEIDFVAISPPKPTQKSKPRWFLKIDPACSSIMQHVGKLSKENCWVEGLESLGVTVTEELRDTCGLAHQKCIEVCNAILPDEKRGVEKYEVYSRLSLTMNYRGANDEWHTIEAPHMDIAPAEVSQLISKGIFPFVAIVPLLKEGNFMRVHPKWKNKKPATEEGHLIYSPLGTIVVIPGTMVYGCGIRTGNGGNPCLKLHYFLKEKGTDETQAFPDTPLPNDIPNDIPEALKYCAATPDGMKTPGHPTKKTADGDHTVYFMERKYLAYLIKASKLERSEKKKKKKGKAKLSTPDHRAVGNFYGPKILEDLYELVGL